MRALPQLLAVPAGGKVAHQTDPSKKLADLLHQVASLRMKSEELLDKPMDDKRTLLFEYISQRLEQIVTAIKSKTNREA